MEEGFVLDQARAGSLPSLWVEGSPERSWWTGTKTLGKAVRVTTTFRCTACGFLESYALRPWTGQIEPDK